jgi:zinc protease
MRLHRYALASVMLCGLQGFFPLFGATSAAQVGVRVSIERFVLPNGLRLIVHENHDLPLAHVRMFYDVAEKDAGPGQTAHAHLFEHLAFSRTEHLDRSIWSFLKAIGAKDYDANSQYDYTHYYTTVPVAVLDTILWMEAERMAHLASALTDEDLVRSRREVFQEAERLLRLPPIRILKETWEHTYPKGHPYAGFNIASEDVNRATLLDARRFYGRYYHPANAGLVVAGDVSPAAVRAVVETRFGSIPARSPRTRSGPRVAQRSETRRRRIDGVLDGAQIRLVWNTPGWGTPTADYLELATIIMTRRLSGRLRGNGLATEINGGTEMRGLGGQVMLDVLSSSPAGFPAIEQIIGEEIGRLASNGPTRAELDHAREEYRGGLDRDAAKLAGVTLLLGIGELLWRDPGHLQLMLERAEGATAEDVRKAVDAWLTHGAFVLEFTPAG